MKQRIALVSHLASEHELTGAERSLLNLATAFRGEGREPVWISPGEGRSAGEARALGLEVHVLGWPRLFLASWQASAAGSALRAARFALGAPRLLTLARRLGELRLDAALVNTLVNAGAVWAARRAGVPVVWRVAEIPGPGRRRALFARQARRWPQALVGVSRAVAAALDVANTRVIPTGVALPDAAAIAGARAELRERLGWAERTPVLGHVGQLRPHKGQREFLAALRGLDLGAWRVAIVGSEADDPGYAAQLRRQAEPFGDRVGFSGFMSGAGRAAAALDLLAFTSTAPDPFPLVVLEALAAGVPVVGFAGGGVPEAVDDGVNGRLVAPGDVAGLAAALGPPLRDEALRAGWGRAARHSAETRFSLPVSARAYLQALEPAAGATPVAAVIVNWNSGEDLPRCLASLRDQTLPPAQVIVVDNASRDGSLERARALFPAPRFLELGENRGFCGGANAGIALVPGHHVLILNPDAWLHPDYLARALPALERPGAGFVAGKVRRPDDRTIDSAGQTLSPLLRRVIERGYGQLDRGQLDGAGPVPSVCGAVALYGRALLERLGPGGRLFDEDFFAFWEDADVGARARRAGFTGWYEPRALAWHRRGATRAREGRLFGRVFQILGRDEAVQFHILKNRWLFLARNEPLPGLVLRAPLLLCFDGALLLVVALFRPGLFRRLVASRGLLAKAWSRRGESEGPPGAGV